MHKIQTRQGVHARKTLIDRTTIARGRGERRLNVELERAPEYRTVLSLEAHLETYQHAYDMFPTNNIHNIVSLKSHHNHAQPHFFSFTIQNPYEFAFHYS
jgi:hypothetical protein